MVKDYSSKEAERVLMDVPQENAFNIRGGSSVKNLKELYSALQNIAQDSFDHHVNEERNDFSSWVRDIHRDYKLANSLSSARTREECAKAVGSRLYEIERLVELSRNRELKETETAAERLEKILSEAVKAKVAASKKKDDTRLQESVVIDMETKKVTKVAARAKNTAATPATQILSELPTVTELLAAPEESRVIQAGKDPADELVKFTEPQRFHRQFGKEMSSLFSASSARSFTQDVKNVFAGGKGAEKKAVAEEKQSAQPVEKPVEKGVRGDKKETIISHLKRVYQ
ncbi:hypothetical protein KY359_06095 [Candidatus Woesearchaeota archaeon]|nr:hypothetical protein [Candidatus Woesearchaeota archaeon]